MISWNIRFDPDTGYPMRSDKLTITKNGTNKFCIFCGLPTTPMFGTQRICKPCENQPGEKTESHKISTAGASSNGSITIGDPIDWSDVTITAELSDTLRQQMQQYLSDAVAYEFLELCKAFNE